MRPLGLSLAFAGVLAGSAHATTWVVNDLGDAPGTCPGPPCTLRAAIAAAQDGDIVSFDGALAFPASLFLAGSELTIGKSITIAGPGPDRLTISAGAQSRVLHVEAGTVRIVGVALANGRHRALDGSAGPPGTGLAGAPGATAEGGCVLVAGAASLHLERVALVSCQALGGDGGDGDHGSSGVFGGMGGPGGPGGTAAGGAIASFGSLSLVESSLQGALAIGGDGGRGGDGGASMVPLPPGFAGAGGNAGHATGAGLYLGPGAALLARNSTVTAGTARGGTGGNGGVSPSLGGQGGRGGDAEGGGAYLGAALALADLEFVSLGPATMLAGPGGIGSGGTTGSAGQARGETLATQSTARVRHAAFVGADEASDCHGTLSPSGPSLASDPSCGFALQGSYVANFVGPGVQEFAGRAVLQPRPGALPVDAAPDCADLDGATVSIDGVGRPRPVDGDGDGDARCDLGAFEYSPRVFADGFEAGGS